MEMFDSPFKAMLSAPSGELGQVKLEWLEDEFYPRMFEITESEHPFVFVGDKVLIIASAPRPQG
jgi:hypothetical protein